MTAALAPTRTTSRTTGGSPKTTNTCLKGASSGTSQMTSSPSRKQAARRACSATSATDGWSRGTIPLFTNGRATINTTTKRTTTPLTTAKVHSKRNSSIRRIRSKHPNKPKFLQLLTKKWRLQTRKCRSTQLELLSLNSKGKSQRHPVRQRGQSTWSHLTNRMTTAATKSQATSATTF